MNVAQGSEAISSPSIFITFSLQTSYMSTKWSIVGSEQKRKNVKDEKNGRNCIRRQVINNNKKNRQKIVGRYESYC